jgi:phage terminase small subunit
MTRRRERFVAEYLADLNATQAAIRAGFVVGSAPQTGYKRRRPTGAKSALIPVCPYPAGAWTAS